MNTKKEIVDRCYFILGEDQSSTVYDKEGEVIPKINEVIDNICRCGVTNLITNQDIHGGLLDFLYHEKTLNVPRSKKILTAIDEDSTEIEVDNVEGLNPEGGYIEINMNIISYEGVTENKLTNVAGINGFHEINSTVNYVYMFGEDLIKASDFFDIKNQDELMIIDFRERIPAMQTRCYAIKPYGAERKCAVFYNCDGPVVISYSQSLPVMEDDEDECGFPKDYGIKIIPNLVIGELLIDTSESEKGKELLTMGYSELENMYRFYATPSKKFRKKIGTRPMKMF